MKITMKLKIFNIYTQQPNFTHFKMLGSLTLALFERYMIQTKSINEQCDMNEINQ